MKAAVYYETGEPEVFRYEDVPDPVCQPQGIIIRTEAISVEGGDVRNRRRGGMTSMPHIVGYLSAGEIVEVGRETTRLKVGDKVAVTAMTGSYCEYRSVRERNAWPIPASLDIKKACVVPVTFSTAHEALHEFAKLKAGETVLIQSGASGLGVAAIQIAKKAGAKLVIATGSSPTRLERLKPLGLDVGIAYDNMVNEVMRITSKRGCDVILDSIGGAGLQSSIQSLAHRGRAITVGRREAMTIDIEHLLAGNRSLIGFFHQAEIASDRTHYLIQQLMDRVARGELQVIVDKMFKLSDAAAAHRYVESRQSVGRVLLVP